MIARFFSDAALAADPGVSKTLAGGSVAWTEADEPCRSAIRAWLDARDQHAATELVDFLSPFIHRVAGRVLPRPWMVDEAVQATLAKVFRSLERFDFRIPLSAWAVRLAKNECANILRPWQRRAVFIATDADLQDEAAAPGITLDRRLIARDELRRVFRGLRALPALDQAIASLVLLGGCSSDDAAAQTGLSSGAVRLRVFRIREALRSSLSATFPPSLS